MKRLTVDQTWEQCLAMYKYVSRQCLGKSEAWCGLNIERLKRQWLSMNGIVPDKIDHDCLFCEYDYLRRGGCRSCPGKRVGKSFDCGHIEYRYCDKPRHFYAEIKRLNKIRLGSK